MTRTWKLILLLAILAALGLWLIPWHTAAARDRTETGHQLAAKYCAQCHKIAPSQSRGWTDAPPFTEIANRPSSTTATLSAVIEQPHMHMLNTGRPRDQAHDIALYIMSLRHR